MTAYTMTVNPEFNSVEISFSEKPSYAIRAALKNLHFRWHSVKQVWYGYTTRAEAQKAIETAENSTVTENIDTTSKPAKQSEKANKYGVKVGDIFMTSWGYEQTNVNFFQVVALVGETSVRVREVYLPIIEETPVSSMSADYTYAITSKLLPPTSRPTFIKDQEKGDIKRINYQYAEPGFKVSSYASAYKCSGETVKAYVSWYA